VGPAWYHRLLRWDAGWYASIVRDGYRYSDDASVPGSTVFYPFYPLVSSAVKSLLGIDQYVALLLVANVASVAAVLLLTKFVAEESGDEIALLSLALFSFFPSSLFLSAGYTESLFLIFIVLGLVLLPRKQFVLTAVSAGLSLGTRPTGIVMIPVILPEMCRQTPQPLPPPPQENGAVRRSGRIWPATLHVLSGHSLRVSHGIRHWPAGMA